MTAVNHTPTSDPPIGLDVVPVSTALGAEIRGLDLSGPLEGATIAAIRAAWLEHLVLLFRGQTLSSAALVAFSGRFGELEIAPLFQGRRFVEDHPEVMILSNVNEGGRELGALGNVESFWHTDLNFVEEPPAGSFLHCLEAPPSGGDTGFCDMYAALESLPGALRARIEPLSIRHDARYNSAGYPREVRVPDAIHPIVRTHPETGRRALYLGRRMNAVIPGVPENESEALLRALWDHAGQSRFSWHHQWRAGDLIIWDNRCTMHRRDPFDASHRRIMLRAQTRGTKPYRA